MAETKLSRWRCNPVGRAIIAIALLVCLAVPLAAIAQDSSNTSTSIVGEYTVVITIPDVPRDIANGPSLYGRWKIILRADGTYGTQRADVSGEMVSGTYSVNGDQLTVIDEAGLLSCGNASIVGNQTDAAEGVYRWTRNDDRLSLVPVEDNCAGRRILFSTRQLTGYLPCTVQPLQVGAAASPEADGSPSAASPEAEASPTIPVDSGTPGALGSPVAEGGVSQAIDVLLSQMTSCWATGQPELFLPLMTSSFRAQFLQSDSSTDPIAALATLMASTPFVWERAGEVDIIDATHATALVRQAVNNQEDFVRYAFELEDGAWRWNGAG
ncbi:MAG: hypothetical protein QOF73_2655 [Thermomicrobiales bacterium]|jgi:hypothetical protein|nr:hypothetical protein [Thermomicrobiales bacterium]